MKFVQISLRVHDKIFSWTYEDGLETLWSQTAELIYMEALPYSHQHYKLNEKKALLMNFIKIELMAPSK